MPYIGNVTTSSNVNGSQINNGTITGDKLSLPFNYDSATLYLDDTNNRVGILTASPSSTLTVDTGGVVSIPLASAATPSLVFGTDTNTGIYSPGADQVAISTGGARRLNIDSTGALILDTGDATIFGVRVGRGAGAISTNTAVGSGALNINTGGTGSTAIGYQALYFNTTGNVNTANGYRALYSNTTGEYNIANGFHALYSNTTGAQNTANGAQALYSNTTGSNNAANGTSALYSNTTGSYNTANGFQALQTNTIGAQNTANGYHALVLNTTGSNNAANGFQSLYGNTTGSSNIGIGSGAGQSLTTGSNNTIIGSIAGTAGLSDTVIIGAGATERLRIDSSGRVGIGTSAANGKLDVADGDVYITKNSGGDVPGITSQSLYVRTQSGNLARLYSISAGSGGPSGFGGNLYIQTKADNGNLADRVTITNGGAVGIGTASPSTLFQASGATAPILRVTDTRNTVNLDLQPANTEAYFGTQSNHPLAFQTNATERARLDTSGRLLVGTSSARTGSIGGNNQVVFEAGSTYLNTILASNINSSDGNFLSFIKSRGASAGSHTIVQSGDNLGVLSFEGADGSVSRAAAQILAQVDGTPGAGDMPGRLVFSTTADGAASPTERFRISSTGAQSSVIPGGSTLYPSFDCRAWVNFNGTGTVAIRGSGNVSSITDNGTGDYTVNFTTAMADTNFSATTSSMQALASPRLAGGLVVNASSFRLNTLNGSISGYEDQPNIFVHVFR
jgi:hypothetical protein